MIEEKLALYKKTLTKWQKTCNLVGPAVLPHIQEHFAEAYAAVPLIRRQVSTWMDIGSGAGLPGIVLACLFPQAHFHLVESRSRKCAFLEEVAQLLSLTATIHWKRAEKMKPMTPDVISARAVAMDQLLPLVLLHAGPSTQVLLFQSLKQKEAAAQNTGTWTKTKRGYAVVFTREEIETLGRKENHIKTPFISPSN